MGVNQTNSIAVEDGVTRLLRSNVKQKDSKTASGINLTNEAYGTDVSRHGTQVLNRSNRVPRNLFEWLNIGLKIVSVGVQIASLVYRIQADKKIEKNFQKVFEGISKNYDAINRNYHAIKNVEEKVDRNFIDYKKARVRVKVGEFLTDWLPWITFRAGENKSWSPLSIDEQIIVLSPGGELALGVVLPAIYQQKYFAPEYRQNVHTFKFEDGTKLSFDSGKLEIDVIDKITLKAGESSIEMTKDNIKLNARRIDLN